MTDNVAIIVFMAAIDEYDLFLEEDPQKSRTEESIELFDNIVNSQWLSPQTKILLLFNKSKSMNRSNII